MNIEVNYLVCDFTSHVAKDSLMKWIQGVMSFALVDFRFAGVVIPILWLIYIFTLLTELLLSSARFATYPWCFSALRIVCENLSLAKMQWFLFFKLFVG